MKGLDMNCMDLGSVPVQCKVMASRPMERFPNWGAGLAAASEDADLGVMDRLFSTDTFLFAQPGPFPFPMKRKAIQKASPAAEQRAAFGAPQYKVLYQGLIPVTEHVSEKKVGREIEKKTSIQIQRGPLDGPVRQSEENISEIDRVVRLILKDRTRQLEGAEEALEQSKSSRSTAMHAALSDAISYERRETRESLLAKLIEISQLLLCLYEFDKAMLRRSKIDFLSNVDERFWTDSMKIKNPHPFDLSREFEELAGLNTWTVLSRISEYMHGREKAENSCSTKAYLPYGLVLGIEALIVPDTPVPYTPALRSLHDLLGTLRAERRHRTAICEAFLAQRGELEPDIAREFQLRQFAMYAVSPGSISGKWLQQMLLATPAGIGFFSGALLRSLGVAADRAMTIVPDLGPVFGVSTAATTARMPALTADATEELTEQHWLMAMLREHASLPNAGMVLGFLTWIRGGLSFGLPSGPFTGLITVALLMDRAYGRYVDGPEGRPENAFDLSQWMLMSTAAWILYLGYPYTTMFWPIMMAMSSLLMGTVGRQFGRLALPSIVDERLPAGHRSMLEAGLGMGGTMLGSALGGVGMSQARAYAHWMGSSYEALLRESQLCRRYERECIFEAQLTLRFPMNGTVEGMSRLEIQRRYRELMGEAVRGETRQSQIRYAPPLPTPPRPGSAADQALWHAPMSRHWRGGDTQLATPIDPGLGLEQASLFPRATASHIANAESVLLSRADDDRPCLPEDEIDGDFE